MNETKRNLATVTRELMLNRPRTVTLSVIEEATGIDHNFMSRFQNGVIAHPSIHKIIPLYEYLSGRKLDF